MWEIQKEFSFCYGHRVWTQSLNKEYSLDSCHACRRMHGHEGVVRIFLQSASLKNGMVTDFKHLGWFKKWLDDTLDHKFIMDINDPARTDLYPGTFFEKGDSEKFDSLFEVHTKGKAEYYTVWPDVYANAVPHLQEIYEGLVFVPFVPTSENLSTWLCNIVWSVMEPLLEQDNIKVSKIEFLETPKSKSIFING